jgi:hypothetical protein
MPIALHVSLHETSLKLTATKPERLFGKAIIGSFLKVHNQRVGSTLTPEKIKRCTLDGKPLALPGALSKPIESLVTEGEHELCLFDGTEPPPPPPPAPPPAPLSAEESELQKKLAALLTCPAERQGHMLAGMSRGWKEHAWRPPLTFGHRRLQPVPLHAARRR